ncbi:MAG: hypothetical protein L6R36_007979 [Xanthoria steineri]|nr:MAG: hypothetical protein L6R36_007979 [Xanthoria steineri]
MAPQPATPRTDSEISPRQRVSKACDRCRMKKSKCDLSRPCGRCKQDDQPCNFEKPKIDKEKIHPKGYPEFLENQNRQLRHALEHSYQLMFDAGVWKGPALEPAPGGRPPINEILKGLGAQLERFEGHPQFIQEEEGNARKRQRNQSTDRTSSERGTFNSNTPSLGTYTSRGTSTSPEELMPPEFPVGPTHPVPPMDPFPNTSQDPSSGLYANPDSVPFGQAAESQVQSGWAPEQSHLYDPPVGSTYIPSGEPDLTPTSDDYYIPHNLTDYSGYGNGYGNYYYDYQSHGPP